MIENDQERRINTPGNSLRSRRSSQLFRRGLSLLLRAGRITRYSPFWKGYEQLLWLYQRIVPEDFLVRIKDFDGDMILDVDVRGAVGISFWHYPNLYEREERRAFCASITPECTVLDVGANIGFYTLLAAKRGARVFAIEADPRNAATLRHHIEINGFSDRVTVFEMAATDSEKPVSLYRHAFNVGESNIMSNGRFCGVVEGKTIDSLNLPPIEVCKMDIEGAEFVALQGMQQTLQRSPEMKLLVEYAERFGNCEALLAYLRANFSQLTVLEKNRFILPGVIPPYCNLLATR